MSCKQFVPDRDGLVLAPRQQYVEPQRREAEAPGGA